MTTTATTSSSGACAGCGAAKPADRGIATGPPWWTCDGCGGELCDPCADEHECPAVLAAAKASVDSATSLLSSSRAASEMSPGDMLLDLMRQGRWGRPRPIFFTITGYGESDWTVRVFDEPTDVVIGEYSARTPFAAVVRAMRAVSERDE
jgi:hypothetical protein